MEDGITITLSTFEELTEYLREFRAWGGGPAFDHGGALMLLAACLDALRRRANEAELAELDEYLEPEQLAFLQRLCASSQAMRSTDP